MGSLRTWHIMKICHPRSTLQGPELRGESPLVWQGHNQRNDEGGEKTQHRSTRSWMQRSQQVVKRDFRREDNSNMLSQKRPRSTCPGMMEGGRAPKPWGQVEGNGHSKALVTTQQKYDWGQVWADLTSRPYKQRSTGIIRVTPQSFHRKTQL